MNGKVTVEIFIMSEWKSPEAQASGRSGSGSVQGLAVILHLFVKCRNWWRCKLGLGWKRCSCVSLHCAESSLVMTQRPSRSSESPTFTQVLPDCRPLTSTLLEHLLHKSNCNLQLQILWLPIGKAHESPENLLASVMIQSVSVRREYARDFKFNPPGVCVSSLWEGRNLTCVRTFKTMR